MNMTKRWQGGMEMAKIRRIPLKRDSEEQALAF
jgi:hypothetical protein